MMNKLEGLCDRLWACAQWHEESAAELVGFGHEQHIRFATLLREAAAELKTAREEVLTLKKLVMRVGEYCEDICASDECLRGCPLWFGENKTEAKHE